MFIFENIYLFIAAVVGALIVLVCICFKIQYIYQKDLLWRDLDDANSKLLKGVFQIEKQMKKEELVKNDLTIEEIDEIIQNNIDEQIQRIMVE